MTCSPTGQIIQSRATRKYPVRAEPCHLFRDPPCLRMSQLPTSQPRAAVEHRCSIIGFAKRSPQLFSSSSTSRSPSTRHPFSVQAKPTILVTYRALRPHATIRSTSPEPSLSSASSSGAGRTLAFCDSFPASPHSRANPRVPHRSQGSSKQKFECRKLHVPASKRPGSDPACVCIARICRLICETHLRSTGKKGIMHSAWFGEFMGTLVLVLLGNGVCAAVTLRKSYAADAGWMVVTTGWALAVLCGVLVAQAFGSPGANLNPAITLSTAVCSGNYTSLFEPLVSSVARSHVRLRFDGAALCATLGSHSRSGSEAGRLLHQWRDPPARCSTSSAKSSAPWSW